MDPGQTDTKPLTILQPFSEQTMSSSKLEYDDQYKWEVNQALPVGGPLRTERYDAFSSRWTTGKGTTKEPAVYWNSRGNVRVLQEAAPESDPDFYLIETSRFAIREVIKLRKGIRHIWLRMHVHSSAYTRTKDTNLPTGETEDADPHITVFLGTEKDHMNLHGHFYVKWPEPPNAYTKEGELVKLRLKVFQTTPYELMDKRDRRRTPSQIGSANWEARNPELWIWDPKRNKAKNLRGDEIRKLAKW
ncbi:hypothetical protein PG989_001287 [Apiospora arundinis]